MTRLKAALATGAMAAVMTAGVLATATPASADVACNRYGECWRVHDRTITYPGELGVTFHEDAWWDTHHPHGYHWRHDHDGHGYYRHGIWIGL
jgi:hypothetical protein